MELREISIKGINEYRLKEKRQRRTYWSGRKLSIESIKEYRMTENKLLNCTLKPSDEYNCCFTYDTYAPKPEKKLSFKEKFIIFMNKMWERD